MSSSNDFLSQQKVWDHRASNWDSWGFDEPLSPNSAELQLQQKYMTPGGKVLVLGATESLCKAALDRVGSVTSVDFAPAAIDTFRVSGINYVCKDWITFLQESADQYDNIVTDNGLCCLEFPVEWELLSKAIHASLRPGGIFSMRAFVATDSPQKNHYDNPNLQRIIPAIGRATSQSNWMVIKPADNITNLLPARYTFPSSEVIEQVFSHFSLIQKETPHYEEGEHFISYVFQRSDN